MSEQAEVIETLSKREAEVAAAYADGASYKEIARDLGISPTTVRSHLRTVYGKLNVTSKIALAQLLADPGETAALPQDEKGLTADLALELDDAMRRERMMADVLRLINRRDTSLDEVIDALLDHALEICESQFGTLFEYHGDLTFSEMRSRGIPDAFAEWLEKHGKIQLSPYTAVGRMTETLEIVHIADVRGEGPEYQDNPMRVATVELGKARSFAAIPIISGGNLIGAFTVYRTRVHPFNDRALELAQAFADQAAIAIENTRHYAAMEARLGQAAATREILEAISSASDDEGPVFEAILGNARKLCDAPFAALVLGREADGYQTMIANHGAVQSTEDIYSEGRIPMDPEKSFAARAIIEKRPIHLPNMKDTEQYRAGIPNVVELCDLQGIRTNLFVPLIKDGEGIGCFIIFRHEVQPFSEEQIALVETFAAQAVIALENVRRFQELQKQLDRDAATREILEAISHSRDDEAPVFDAILRNAAKICGSPMARLELANRADNTFHCAAAWGEEMRSFRIGEAMSLDHPNDLPTAIREGVVRHIHDLSKTELYLSGDPTRVRMVEEEGYRTYLVVPLLADGVGVGGIVLSRREVAPFAESDIALLESFARQAVIAIENVRQFRDLRDRLDREATTREILGLLARVREDEQPVFEAILDNATRLCGAPNASLILGREGDRAQIMVANRGATTVETREHYNSGAVPMDPKDSLVAQAIIEQQTIHAPDMAETDGYKAGHPRYRMLVEEQGIRTNLFVPLTSPDGGVGCFILWKSEVSPFTPDQIALVETFAAQAAIALENVRQFREVQKRLDQEAATSRILGAISASREDDVPVFHTILENACRVCDAQSGFITVVDDSGEYLTGPAQYGVGAEFASTFDDWSVHLATSPLGAAQCIRERRAIPFDDIADTDLYREGNRERVRQVDIEGMRSIVCVPLLTRDTGLGSMILYRKQVQPFTAEEITMVEAFAAQAVIAIENAQQFRALQSRLEREAASTDILDAISRARDDAAPVFDMIVERAASLCSAQTARVLLLDPEAKQLRYVASCGTDLKSLGLADEFDYDEGQISRAIRERCVINCDDLSQDPEYLRGDPVHKVLVEQGHVRSRVVVPLSSGDHALGAIALSRHEVRPFTDDEIHLVSSFAAQAVIAIENAQQFRALQDRTAEVQSLNASLEAKVEDQVGEIERMGKLKRFLPAAVADTVISTGSEGMLQSHRALLGVLFCDIRGFTAFCETAEPEETIEVLQTYHEEMGKLINAHGAGVDLRMGDGVMVLFNDPIPCDDPAGDAVRLGIAMRERMAELCKRWRRLGHRLGFGVGVSLGYATVGMVGFEGRFDYTASGTAINLASRLCDEAEDGEILLSTRAGIAVEEDFAIETRGELNLKGIREPVEVFRLVGKAGA